MRPAPILTVLLSSGIACTATTGPNISDVPGYLIANVYVRPSIDTLFVQDSITDDAQVTFSAVAMGKNGLPLSGMKFVWSVSDPATAAVDSAGVVVARQYGTVEITASADKVGRATLVILPAPPIVE